MIHMWIYIVDYNYTEKRRLVQPFLASFQIGMDKEAPGVNMTQIHINYPDGLPNPWEIINDLSEVVDKRMKDLRELIRS